MKYDHQIYKNYGIKDYYCQICHNRLQHTSKLILTSYPIDWVLECPNCNIDYYLLVDGILCTEKDYNNRVYQYYERGL